VNLIDLDMLGSVFLAVILQKLSGEKWSWISVAI
jgi:hypothetical protein